MDLSAMTDVGCTFLIRTWHVMYFNSLPSGCVPWWLSLKLVMLECTAYGASKLIDDVVIGEWIIASIYCMKFSFSLVNSVWRNYIVPLQCANIINNCWLCIVADASHSCHWYGWWWWWSPTATTAHTSGIDGNTGWRIAHYGKCSPHDCKSRWLWCTPRT